jgi:hypothetical protein
MDRDEIDPAADPDEESFLVRWSRRKLRADAEPEEPNAPGSADAAPRPDEPAVSPPTDEDMPAIESLGDDDDYSGFLSLGVSETLRRRALKRLFLSSKFNVTDGLDDYAEDYTQFASLGSVVTADMKHCVDKVLARPNDDDGASDGERTCSSEPAAQASGDSPTADSHGEVNEPMNDPEEQSPA